MRSILSFALFAAACTGGALGVPEDTPVGVPGPPIAPKPPIGNPSPGDPSDPSTPGGDPPALPPAGSRCGGAIRTQISACGPGDRCVVLRDEALPPAWGNNDGPQIVLDDEAPLVFVPTTDTINPGQLLRRANDGSWSASSTERGVTGALAHSLAGVGRLDDDGAYGVLYADESPTGWTSETIAGDEVAFGGGLALDDRGCVYAALYSDDTHRTRFARRDDSWHFANPFGDRSIEHTRVALSDTGQPHLIGVDPFVGDLVWVEPPGNPRALQLTEPVSPGLVRFDVVADRPQVLFVQGDDRLVYTNEASGWVMTSIAKAQTLSGDCGDSPSPGAQCTAQALGYEPVAVLTDTIGSVRLVWSQSTLERHGVAYCSGPPSSPSCFWDLSSAATSTTIHVGTPDDLQGASTVILGALTDANAALDDDGQIHVVGYNGMTTRYLLIGR